MQQIEALVRIATESTSAQMEQAIELRAEARREVAEVLAETKAQIGNFQRAAINDTMRAMRVARETNQPQVVVLADGNTIDVLPEGPPRFAPPSDGSVN